MHLWVRDPYNYFRSSVPGLQTPCKQLLNRRVFGGLDDRADFRIDSDDDPMPGKIHSGPRGFVIPNGKQVSYMILDMHCGKAIRTGNLVLRWPGSPFNLFSHPLTFPLHNCSTPLWNFHGRCQFFTFRTIVRSLLEEMEM